MNLARYALGAALLCALSGCLDKADSQTATDTITWTHPTERTDNSPLPLNQIKHTQVSWGTAAGGPYTGGSVNVPGPATTTTFQRTTAGTRCYVAYTVDLQDRISAASNEACKTIVSPPKAPSGLAVQ